LPDTNRRLDFLVPIYNEGESVVKTLLDSIALQRSVDLSQVGVIICCDGGTTELSNEFINSYPFEIEFHMCEHRGVSATRNECLDRSKAEYCIFADCDDCLMDCRGLYLVFREMDMEPNAKELTLMGVPQDKWESGFDFLVCDFVEETKDPKTDGMIYVTHPGLQNFTFIHSQLFRRQWLIDNELRFNPALSTHEDSFLIVLCRETVKPWRAKHCSFSWYLWAWRTASICRHDPKYILKTYNCMLDSSDAVVDELTRRMLPDHAKRYAATMMFDAFYTLNKQEWIDSTNAEYRDAVERRFTQYYRKHRSKYESLTSQEKAVISSGVRNRSVMEGMLLEALTIDQWLERILEKYPEETQDIA